MNTGTDILNDDVKEFIRLGSIINIVNPQTEVEFEGKHVVMKGHRLLDLTRLDYLALGSEKCIAEIMIDCLGKYNLSCPASQVVTKMDANLRLEQRLADFHGMAATTMFLNGYAANENILQALGLRLNAPHLLPYFRSIGLGKESRKMPTIFFVDGESHYSALHGMKIASKHDAEVCIIVHFPSMDHNKLVQKLKNSYIKYGNEAVRIIVSDTVSSTTGKIFDVGMLCKIAAQYDCMLYLDEAHAVGALGSQGKGIAAQFQEFKTHRDRIMVMGTLTKTFCQIGGYVTMPNEELNQFLRVCCPQYIFSAPLPPWMAEAVLQIIEMIAGDFDDTRRKKLATISEYLRVGLNSNGFETMGSGSHIIPVHIGDEQVSTDVKEFLLEKGLATALFIHPAVQRGHSTIRMSLCADIEEEEVDYIVNCFKQARDKFHF
jgi:7-keto-8-aminopelargonate synthetase-like enzyme